MALKPLFTNSLIIYFLHMTLQSHANFYAQKVGRLSLTLKHNLVLNITHFQHRQPAATIATFQLQNTH